MSTSLNWREVTIPDSSPPVTVATLREEPGGGFWGLVRFPPGWARPVSGHYLVDEEFWVLEGELTMSGETYGPEQVGRIPSGAVRRDSRAETGALTLAHFAGPARWVRE
jgi:hypothetical protein